MLKNLERRKKDEYTLQLLLPPLTWVDFYIMLHNRHPREQEIKFSSKRSNWRKTKEKIKDWIKLSHTNNWIWSWSGSPDNPEGFNHTKQLQPPSSLSGNPPLFQNCFYFSTVKNDFCFPTVYVIAKIVSSPYSEDQAWFHFVLPPVKADIYREN